MAETPPDDVIVREIEIAASPETVFAFFTDADKLTRWLAVDATVDPRPGGTIQQTHSGGSDGPSGPYRMRGTFVELDPPTRLVFTWGFENPELDVRPGESTVEVTLERTGDGTLLRLVHRGLPASELRAHRDGWIAMLDRLATAAG